MGVSFNKDIVKSIRSFESSILNKVEKAHHESANYIAGQIDLNFENRGFLEPKSGRKQVKPWEPTTFAAKKSRKNYPKTSGKTGEKGLTQTQARYLFSSPTLTDTGALRSSIAIDTDKSQSMLVTYSGAGKTYIKTHEEGGILNIKGKSFVVPPRPSHFLTANDENIIEGKFEVAI